LSSLLAGWVALGIFYVIGKAIGGHRTGLVLVFLLMVDPIFATASCLVRPETLLLLTSALVLWLILSCPSDFFLRGFWIGLIAGLQVAIHPNTLALLPGFLIVAGLLEERKHRTSLVVTFIVGAGAGIILALLAADLHRLWLAHGTFVAQMSRPPVFSPPRSLSAFFRFAASKVYMTESYFFQDDPHWHWRTCLRLRGLGIGFLLIAACVTFVAQRSSDRRPDRIGKAFLYGLAASFLTTIALVARTEVLYNLNIYPFLLPLIALYWTRDSNSQRRVVALLKRISGLLLLGSLCFFISFTNAYRFRCRPFSEVQAQFAALVPNHALKVVAPNLFWYQWPKDHFRDIGALMYSHWYSGGQKDLSLWLGRWAPDILVIDSPFKRIFLGPGPTGPRLAQVLKTGVRYLGAIDTGEGSYGSFEVYELRWSKGVK